MSEGEVISNENENQKLKLRSQYRFQWEKAQNSYVLLYPEGMVQLPGSAGEIMKLVTGENSTKEIVKILENKFPEADLKADVFDFLNKAYENGWIQKT